VTNSVDTDTIAAVATSGGAGGVGIVRLSGPRALEIGEAMCGRRLSPRRALRAEFRDAQGAVLDDGIVLAFPGPGSYTGEDVLELQAHGSPVVLRQLVAAACALGARPARPGEFSERAFLNGRLDLAQAEAVADLIAAGDARAARAARRSLEGEFSRRVEAVGEGLMTARMHVEAAIDFADEPIETLGGAQLRAGLQRTQAQLETLLREAEHGRKLRDGLHVVIAGPPNAGKSSLLNALAGADRAIVTDVAGTTRDVLREMVRIDGMELTLADTAGLREGGDAIEREGMRRARAELAQADLVLVVVDAREPDVFVQADEASMQLSVYNKVDLLSVAERTALAVRPGVRVSARTGEGLEALRATLAERLFGAPSEAAHGEFLARARHVDGLRRGRAHLQSALGQLDEERLELAAEELRLAHEALGEITGRVTADDMLGKIFASFCIGK